MTTDLGPGRQSAQTRLAAERAAAARQRIATSTRRRRLMFVCVPILAVVLLVAVLVVVKVTTGAGGPSSGEDSTVASRAVRTAVTSVPPAVLDSVGVGSNRTSPTLINGSALTQNGKPKLLYVGAEYCPFCAAERWSVIVALSRFGTFTGLGQTTSSPSDVYPSTATLTFHGASYRSSYVSFTGVEMQSNRIVDGHYGAMDTLSEADRAVFLRYQPNGSIPFVDIGGTYTIAGASYNPSVIHGRSHATIAAALSTPTSAIAQGVDGSANVITAAICVTTKNRPAAVCSTPGVRAGARALGNG